MAEYDTETAADEDPKVRENRLRRAAKRQRLVLLKSRRRDPRAPDYGGWMIADYDNRGVFGFHPNAYSASIDEIEAFLKGEDE